MRRRTVRLEGCTTDTSTFLSTRAGWAERFTPLLTGAIKIDAARDNIVGADDLERIRFTAGLARRPASADATDWFGLYQVYSELEAGERRIVQIVSSHANRQFGTDWGLSGRVVSKWEDASGNSSSAQLVGGRLIYNLDQNLDLELNGAMRAVNFGDACQGSIGAAGSWQPHSDIRLTVGYNFIGVDDRDLDPSGYDAQGIYWIIAASMMKTGSAGWCQPRDKQAKPKHVMCDEVWLARA